MELTFSPGESEPLVAEVLKAIVEFSSLIVPDESDMPPTASEAWLSEMVLLLMIVVAPALAVPM